MISWFSSLVKSKPRQQEQKVLKTAKQVEKEENEKKWLQSASASTTKLYNRVKKMITKDKKKINEPSNKHGQSIVDEVVLASYNGTDKLLALNMLEDLFNAGGGSRIRPPLDLLDYSSHQSLTFIARLFASGAAKRNLTSSNTTFQGAFEAYFEYSMSAICGLGRGLLLSGPKHEIWKDFSDGIALFCNNGGRPHKNWIFRIDRIVIDREKEEVRLVEKDTCMDLIKFILEQDVAITHENIDSKSENSEPKLSWFFFNSPTNLFAKPEAEASWLHECVKQERYEVANLLIEYGHIQDSIRTDNVSQFGIKQLAQNPNLALGFKKLVERRERYTEQLKSVKPSDLGGGAFTSLFGVSALLSIIVDCI